MQRLPKHYSESDFIKCRDRWYDLKHHPQQYALMTDPCRFKIAAAGRRSGKTENAKRYLIKQAMKKPGKYFAAAPTHDQAQRIFWDDLKLLSFWCVQVDLPLYSVPRLRLNNGSTIDIIGLDKPQRIEGIPWKGGIIDEIANTKADAWTMNIKPALNTINPLDPDHRAWCWLVGVPEGLNHYYDLAEYARTSGDPDWGFYTWKSAEILPPDEVEKERRTMSARQFKQEYEGSFETAGGRIYDDYDASNTTGEVIQEHEQLLWCHDFNYSPLSSVICVVRGSQVFALDEIVLQSAVARQTAVEFAERYKEHKNRRVLIYGDPAGKAGEKHGQTSNYNEIETYLKDNGWYPERRVRAAAPAIRDRQNAVRAKICNAAGERNLFVNAKKCVYMHKGFSTVQLKEGSAFIEKETDYQHITTAIGYMIAYEYPILMPVQQNNAITIPRTNMWANYR